MSTLGIAGATVFLLFGIGLLILFSFICIMASTCVLFSSDYMQVITIPIFLIIIGIVIGIADSKLKKKSNKKRR